jgi:cytochrome c oxidase assembly protein subunit 15
MPRLLHRAARAALGFLILLVFVGASVRALGAGLGCPDWPRCWGNLIPPWNAEQIDVGRLDLERFRRHAERHGMDPESITLETVLAEFDPFHTWVEFVNRLTSLPLGFSVLVLFVASFSAPRHRAGVVILAAACLVDVLGNAWMGAEVVRSGLKPGVITAHLALAFLLVCLLTTLVRLTGPVPAAPALGPLRSRILGVSLVFFVCLVGEGILGSQVREQTDVLARAAGSLPRSSWIGNLEQSAVYLVHRSFSWSLLLSSALLLFWVRCSRRPGAVRPRLIFLGVLAMMVMGVILAHVAVHPVVQVLHVGLTSVLVCLAWGWLLEVLSTVPATAVVATAGRGE